MKRKHGSCTCESTRNSSKRRLDNTNNDFGSKVAEAVISQYFKQVKRTFLPSKRSNGTVEWTCLCGIVIQNTETDELECVSFGAGLKCLSINQIKPYLLHDSHAEVLCKRSFQRFLYDQIKLCIKHEPSIFYLDKTVNRFTLHSQLQFHIYISKAPCGEAALDSLATNFKNFYEPRTAFPDINQHVYRGHFGLKMRDTLRTKPGRGDSSNCVSLSCSDKLTIWSILGFQGTLLSSLMSGSIIPNTIVLPESVTELHEILHKRLQVSGIELVKPKVILTVKNFPFSDTAVLQANPNSILAAANIGTAGWKTTSGSFRVEYVTNGYKFGKGIPMPPRLQGISELSKKCMIAEFLDIANSLSGEFLVVQFIKSKITCKDLTYNDFKRLLAECFKDWTYFKLKRKVFTEHYLLKNWLHTNQVLSSKNISNSICIE